MKTELVTPPTAEPVSLAETKLHCRVDQDVEDAWFATTISAARQLCETMSGRAFIEQTWRRYLDCFPTGFRWGECGAKIRLPMPRLKGVTGVTYYDADNVLQTLATTEYEVDAIDEPGYIIPAYGKAWPSTRPGVNKVIVEYTAGWDAASDVDARVKQAILLLVSHWYENRETVLVGTISKELEFSVKTLMGQLWHGHLWDE